MAHKMGIHSIGIEGLWLIRLGTDAVVRVEIDGTWMEVVRESLDGEFSHIVEPNGIQAVKVQISDQHAPPGQMHQ